ncbi:phytanoyl-CoA dioxygenase family protein [Pseudoduganella violaceinigra]|uniref:phytanoyl-CoA dioxygenase family protein n=1 Tax=Pseudoduganella violaceinigra TaxID=246602 RepID=UPI000416E12B|nr:phytanoyl-CoA dioxygenase family protein [Pseudoduganella violaceinigra]
MDFAEQQSQASLPSPLARAGQLSFWLDLNPDLPISVAPLARTAPTTLPGLVEARRHAADTIAEGYFQTVPIIPRSHAGRLAQAISGLVQRGIPPIFCMVYDAFWQMFAPLDPVLRELLGERYQMMPTDIWAWHVAPQDNASGWGPHRDLETPQAIGTDGRPRLLNVWLPLTDVSPLNACMYVLPQHLDRSLGAEGEQKELDLNDWQNIRALPVPAGAALGWNTHVLHWGGRSSTRASQPRISVGIYFHNRDCDLHEINPDTARAGFTSLDFDPGLQLPFEARLQAIAGAIYMYNRRVPADFPDTWEHIFQFARQYKRN